MAILGTLLFPVTAGFALVGALGSSGAAIGAALIGVTAVVLFACGIIYWVINGAHNGRVGARLERLRKELAAVSSNAGNVVVQPLAVSVARF